MEKSRSLRKLKIVVAICFLTTTLCKSQENGIFKEVNQSIQNSSKFDQKKLFEIDSLRQILKKTPKSDLLARYHFNEQMFYQFKFFKRDSAFYYGINSKNLALQLNNKVLIANANMNLADICVSSGMYKEALDFLEPLKQNESKENYGTLYYGILGRCYGDMAEYSNNPYFQKEYNDLARKYREKALALTDGIGFFHYFLKAFNTSKNKQVNEALIQFNLLLKGDYKQHDKALVHYMLGDIYQQLGQSDKAINHFSKAVISDIATSTKESLAIIKLSELLFKKGDLQNASLLIQKANGDAIFYGAQQRKIQVGAILPFIAHEILKNVENEKQRLYWQYIIASSFLILAICFVIIIYFQYRKLNKAKKIIADAHHNLESINKQLTKVNAKIKSKNIEIKEANFQLLEANKIKEEYLGLFFTQNELVFEKFSALNSKIKKYLDDKNYEKAEQTISSYNLKREKEKILENFDTAFINLFPNFIKEFNLLMKDEHKINLNKEQLLSKELRIYALIRLGITHNEIIAQILGYSVNSIYAYKTKIRNNSIINKDDFDQKLLKKTTLKL
ncbi:MAG: tetratricopeptide repeat protein [Flavobacterium sp.]|nr:tetratricopeptide repeat protein [Flavobacterium sp.]